MSMPVRWATCSTVSPFSTSTIWLSIFSSIIAPSDFQTAIVHGAAVFYEIFEFIPVFLDKVDYRHGGGVAQCADGVAHDALGDAFQGFDVALLALALADPGDDLVHPVAAFPA